MKIGLTIYVTLVICSFGLISDAAIEGELSLWYLTPDGTGAAGTGGTSLDLERDLGYGGDEQVLSLTAVIGGFHQLGINYFRLDMSENARAVRTFTFDGLEFPQDVALHSTLESTFLRGFYRMNIGNTLARGGIEAGLQYLDLEAGIEADNIGFSRASAEAVIPYIGGYFRAHPLPFLGFRCSLMGSQWDIADVEATWLDMEVGAELTVFSSFFLSGGYRQITMDASYDPEDLDIDLTFSGPFVLVGMEW